MLRISRTGQPTDLVPLLIVHGLYGSARNWGAVARRMSAGREVITVDMRNHGQSPWHDSNSYPDMAGDLAEVIGHIGAKVDVMGHSMGGKASMVLALNRPDLIRRLIVADIAPVAYRHDQTQFAKAMQALDLQGVATRSAADRRFAELVPDPGIRAFLLQSLDLKAAPPRWRLNLDVLKAEMPKTVGFPEVSGRFKGLALFLSGAESDYVKPAYRERIKALFPAARFARIPGAGHWLHADKPRETEAAMQAFLVA